MSAGSSCKTCQLAGSLAGMSQPCLASQGRDDPFAASARRHQLAQFPARAPGSRGKSAGSAQLISMRSERSSAGRGNV
jgi:hypothetical protein